MLSLGIILITVYLFHVLICCGLVYSNEAWKVDQEIQVLIAAPSSDIASRCPQLSHFSSLYHSSLNDYLLLV